MRARHLMIPTLVLAVAAGACGAEVQTGAGAGGPQVSASVTATSSLSVAPSDDAAATIEAAAIRDGGELSPPDVGEGFSSAELETARDEIRPLMTGSGAPGEPVVFGIGIGNALKVAMVDAVGDFDVLAERLAAVVSDPERVCLQTNGNSTTFFTITLDEPVGDRTIVFGDTGDAAGVGDPNALTAPWRIAQAGRLAPRAKLRT